MIVRELIQKLQELDPFWMEQDVCVFDGDEYLRIAHYVTVGKGREFGEEASCLLVDRGVFITARLPDYKEPGPFDPKQWHEEHSSEADE